MSVFSGTVEYSSDQFYSPKVGAVTVTCKILGQYTYCLVIQTVQKSAPIQSPGSQTQRILVQS